MNLRKNDVIFEHALKKDKQIQLYSFCTLRLIPLRDCKKFHDGEIILSKHLPDDLALYLRISTGIKNYSQYVYDFQDAKKTIKSADKLAAGAIIFG
jgi:hypothetical protein